MHLGNYIGAVRQWARLQSPEAFYCVVDLHALTQGMDPEVLRARTAETVAWLLAAGLDPEVCTVFTQSRVPYHAQMNWLLECVASYGELSRMTQFKEKAERQTGYRVGLFTYPVLMAGDILLYDTDQVPVGDDQRQHLELTREVAERFNGRYGVTFKVPVATHPGAGARVMDLQEPTRKMSKSVSSPLGTINLLDSASEIEKKIKKSVTDTEGEVRFDWDDKPGVSNLLEIFAALNDETPDSVAARYTRYGSLKGDLATLVIETVLPMASRYQELMSDRASFEAVVDKGAQKAAAVSEPIYRRAAHAMGLY